MNRIALVISAVVWVGGAARAWVSIPAERFGVGKSIAAFANGDWVTTATFYDSLPDEAGVAGTLGHPRDDVRAAFVKLFPTGESFEGPSIGLTRKGRDVEVYTTPGAGATLGP